MWVLIYTLLGTICSLLFSALVIKIFGSSLLFANDILALGPMLTFLAVFSLGIIFSFGLGINKQIKSAKRKGRKPVRSVIFGILITIILLPIISLFTLGPIPMFNPFMMLVGPVLNKIYSHQYTRKLEKFQEAQPEKLEGNSGNVKSFDGSVEGKGIAPAPYHASLIRNSEILILPDQYPNNFKFGQIELGPIVKVKSDGLIDRDFSINMKKSLETLYPNPNAKTFVFEGQLPQGWLCFYYEKALLIFGLNGTLQQQIMLPMGSNFLEDSKSLAIAENDPYVFLGVHTLTDTKSIYRFKINEGTYQTELLDFPFVKNDLELEPDAMGKQIDYVNQFENGNFLIVDKIHGYGNWDKSISKAYIVKPSGEVVWSETLDADKGSLIKKITKNNFTIQALKFSKIQATTYLSDSGPIDEAEVKINSANLPATINSSYELWDPAALNSVNALLEKGNAQIMKGMGNPTLTEILNLGDQGYLLIGALAVHQKDRNYLNAVKIKPDGEVDDKFLTYSLSSN